MDRAAAPRLEGGQGDAPASLQRQHDPAARQTAARWLIGLVGLWALLPPLVQTLTAPKYRGRVGELAPPSSRLSELANVGLTLAVLVAGAAVVLVFVRERLEGKAGALVLFLAPWAYVVVRDLFDQDLPSPYALVYPVLALALWVLRPGLGVLRVVGYTAGAAALVAVALGFGLPAKGVFYYSSGELVSEGKATLPWGILVGHFTHGNKLGGFLALGMPWLLLVPNRFLRIGLLVVSGFALYWSASRGAMGAVVLGALVILGLRLVRPRLRPVVGVVTVVSGMVVASVLPLVVSRPELFSNRGMIWMYGVSWWGDSLWFGLGSDWFDEVGGTTQRIASTAFHGHNQFIHLGVTGGVVLVVLCAALAVLVTWRAATAPEMMSAVAVGYLVVLAVVGVLERPLGLVDNTSFMPVVLLPLAVLAFSSGDRSTGGHLDGSAPTSRD